MTHEKRADEDEWENLGAAEKIAAEPLSDEPVGTEELEPMEVDSDAELKDRPA